MVICNMLVCDMLVTLVLVMVSGWLEQTRVSPTNISIASHFTPLCALSPTTMEEDRAATNLGPDVDEAIAEEPAAVPRQPRRRFVGRKTADKGGEQQADPNANIEDSSAIQGVRRLVLLLHATLANITRSRPAPPRCPRPERHPG